MVFKTGSSAHNLLKALLTNIAGKHHFKRWPMTPRKESTLGSLIGPKSPQELLQSCIFNGVSGRYPLVIEISKQVVKYYSRLKNLDAAGVNYLVRQVFVEEKAH